MILHERTANRVEQLIVAPPHALLLEGANGIGKGYVAEHVLSRILGIDPNVLTTYPYFKSIIPDKGTISIDAIRELQRFLQLKTAGTVGTGNYKRAVLVEHAEALTAEAQNAYLKLLEEPPADTIMLLTAHSARSLLPTIRSRLQAVPILTPDPQAVQQYFGSHDKTLVTQAFFLSGGLPGLMHALLFNEKEHPLFNAVTNAKQILQKTMFERLAMVELLVKSKDDVRYLLEALTHIAQTGLNSAATKKDPVKIAQWHRILKQTSIASDALAGNANTKLALTNMMLQL